MRSAKRNVLAVVSGFGVLLGLSSLAWACTLPDIRLDRVSGPAGTEVNVTGSQFSEDAVEIRWETKTGALLATAEGPEFSVEVTVPESSAGVAYMVAVQKSKQVAVAEFEVTDPAAEKPDRDQTTNGGSGTSLSTNGGTENQTNPDRPSDPEPQTAAEPIAITTDEAPNAPISAGGAGLATKVGAAPREPASPFVGSRTFSGHPYAGPGVPPTEVQRSAGAREPFSTAAPRSSVDTAISPFTVGVALLSLGLVGLFAGFVIVIARKERIRS
jgi:hypothetical protein